MEQFQETYIAGNRDTSFDNTAIAFSYKSDSELKKTYRLFAAMNSSWLTQVGTSLVKLALKFKLPVRSLIKSTVFNQFVGGETINDCQNTVKMLARHHIRTILDYSVEGATVEAGFEATTCEILETIEKAATVDFMPFAVFKVTGIASTPLLEKVQRKETLTEKEQAAYLLLKERVEKLCRAANDAGIGIFIDGEETWIQDVIDELAAEMMQKFNKERAVVYNTFQMYRKDMLGRLKDAHRYATMHQYFLGAKLVRGAYMEKERDRAEDMGYASPIQPNKEATDNDFNRALLFCVNNKQRVFVVCGSHNEYSNHYLMLLMEKHSVVPNDARFYFAQLYGMSDNISFNLAAAGYNVAKYVPYGPLESVMPYLFRRASENTSVAGQSSREFTLVRKEMDRRNLQVI